MFLALGAPEEAYAPGDLDRAYVAGDARCFPLIVAYGDVEFHFAAPTELTTLFVDSFSGRRGAPDGGPLKLADPGPLREGTSLAQFEAAAAALGIGIRSIRPYSPPYAFVALTEGGVEVGFEHDDRTRRVRSPCCGGSAGRIPSPKERAIAAVGNRLRPIATMPHSRNDTPMTPNDLYAFLSDKRLVDLIERVKISDDFLDVVSLTETQHSDMLAWCLHPNEGHGQGDAVIKDFLIAAYEAGQETNKFANKIFFETWTPGKIRTSSFGSAFIAREFSLTTADTRRGRLDLFLIDPGNKIIVTIENKAGASLTETQLSDYYAAVSQQISNRRVFSDYQFAYIVVDRDLADYPEEHLKSLGNKWALLDYGWLEASANRARLHLERNNEAAQLLMAYCQKQTGWQSPNEKQVNELAAELASQHEAVVEAIRLQRKVQPTEWTPTTFGDQTGELLLFIQQNRQLCDHLVQSRGIASVRVGLRKTLPQVKHDEVEYSRTWLRFATAEMESLMADGYWPIFLNVRRDTQSDEANTRFTIRLIWVTGQFHKDNCDVEALRQHMAKVFPAWTSSEAASIGAWSWPASSTPPTPSARQGSSPPR